MLNCNRGTTSYDWCGPTSSRPTKDLGPPKTQHHQLSSLCHHLVIKSLDRNISLIQLLCIKAGWRLWFPPCSEKYHSNEMSKGGNVNIRSTKGFSIFRDTPKFLQNLLQIPQTSACSLTHFAEVPFLILTLFHIGSLSQSELGLDHMDYFMARNSYQ